LGQETRSTIQVVGQERPRKERFDMGWKYKLTEDGSAVAINDKGLPIIVDDSGKEQGLDALHLYSQVPALKLEAKGHREAKEAAEAKLQKLRDLGVELDEEEEFDSWIEKASTAIGTVENLDQKKLVDAGEIDQIKKQAQEAAKKQMEEIEKRNEKKMLEMEERLQSANATIFNLMVADRFNTSPFVKEKLSMTPKMARKYFSDYFKVESEDNGSRAVVGYYPDGQKIYSMERAGELADFEEALSILVDKDPDRESLLVGVGASGSGAEGTPARTGSPAKNPWKKDTWNLTEQGKLVRENLALAKRLASEAGRPLKEV